MVVIFIPKVINTIKLRQNKGRLSLDFAWDRNDNQATFLGESCHCTKNKNKNTGIE
jgi:hypothetical protein